jgi:hypothetical protein
MTPRMGAFLASQVLVVSLVAALSLPARGAADDGRAELASAGAALAGYTLSTGVMVGLAAIPIVRCDHDLACLGTAFLSISTFVLTHPFVAAAAVHASTSLAGDTQPYWHSLVGQTAGDALAVTAFALGARLAPRHPDAQAKRRSRALIFTTCVVLSALGPLVLRPVLDDRSSEPRGKAMALRLGGSW